VPAILLILQDVHAKLVGQVNLSLRTESRPILTEDLMMITSAPALALRAGLAPTRAWRRCSTVLRSPCGTRIGHEAFASGSSVEPSLDFTQNCFLTIVTILLRERRSTPCLNLHRVPVWIAWVPFVVEGVALPVRLAHEQPVNDHNSEKQSREVESNHKFV
jgi:hypothetical protein